LHGLVETGGEAKVTIQAGQVRLNGVVETRRRKKLAPGDVVELRGKRYSV
jgi:ribosome-associated protein